MENRNHKNYYSNPAFSQQSEFQNSGVPLNHVNLQNRQSPVGAQTPYYHPSEPSTSRGSRAHQYKEINENDDEEEDEEEEEQEFYEEMLVDGSGMIKEKKVLMVSRETSPSTRGANKTRYEYIAMKEQGNVNRYASTSQNNPKTPTKKRPNHRYAPVENAQEESPRNCRNINEHRYEYISEDYPPSTRALPVQPAPDDYIRYLPPPANNASLRYNNNVYHGENVWATRRLQQLLSTPPSERRAVRLLTSPQKSGTNPFVSPNKRTGNGAPPRGPRVKLNYASSACQRLLHQQYQRELAEKRSTAVVAPICASPARSLYSETTFSRAGSWMNVRNLKKPTQLTLAVAAFMMMLCGGLTSGLCFYMVSIMGRLYFLDFGIVSGFTCLVLGLLGFRTRNCYWLPNRNYISGYIVLSVFSLLMCVGLLVLLVLQPRPGTPLADMTSGAVCGISVLSLVLACVGVVTSYCCKYPPPDNRVQHSVPGFVV